MGRPTRSEEASAVPDRRKPPRSSPRKPASPGRDGAGVRRQLAEALERERATSEILRVIAGSRSDVQPVFDTITESATRLCDAAFAAVHRFENGLITLAAHFDISPDDVDTLRRHVFPFRADRGSATGRAILDGRPAHIHDVRADPEYRLPTIRTLAGYRTVLSVPVLRDGEPIGAINVWRRTVRPFSERQVALLETFAAQAVIAIENARLFQESQARNRELTEALEQQTATAEILRVISSSPTDLQPVLDVVAANAARVCGAADAQIMGLEGEVLRLVAKYGSVPSSLTMGTTIAASRGGLAGRAVGDRQTIHVEDLLALPPTEFPETLARTHGAVRTMLATPLLREGAPIGVITIRRIEMRPFSEKQVALLETFADQAVIAIENVRLFQELQARNRELTEALEQQTATAEILRVISSSPTDLQPVFDAVADNASRLCEASDVIVFRVDGDALQRVVSVGPFAETIRPDQQFPAVRGSVAGRAVVDRRTIHIHDLASESDDEFPVGKDLQRRYGHRTMLAVPLLREGVPIGVIAVVRTEVRPFSDGQVSLLETFAAQAVLAVENVRLFQELQARNRELTEALEQQTATAEILQVISRSPTDVQPVFDAIVRSSVRICGAAFGGVTRLEGERIHLAALEGVEPDGVDVFRRLYPIPLDSGSMVGRAMLERHTLNIADMAAERLPTSGHGYKLLRSQLTVPMLAADGQPVGAIAVCHRDPGVFPDRQVAMLETFAAQAVIAIENVRLFQELEARNRELTEALEQQTATAEILRVISRSPTDVRPVFETIAASATKLCSGLFGNVYRLEDGLVHFAASYNIPEWMVERYKQSFPVPPHRGLVAMRAMLDREVVNVADAQADPEFRNREISDPLGMHSIVAVPILRDGVPIGAIAVGRTVAESFEPNLVALLRTFADQAVIAIENVRLFKELEARNRDLTQALDQQTATSEILRVISSAHTDAQPVFDAIVRSAARLCNALTAAVFRVEGGILYHPANYGGTPEALAAARARYPRPVGMDTGPGQAILARAPVQSPDIEDPSVAAAIREAGRLLGFRSTVAVPMLSGGEAVGVIVVTRQTPGLFSEAEVELLKTFTAQAVIAIENVRLFTELQTRTRELTRSVEELRALGEVGQAVSSTLDLETVLTTIVSRAAQLAGADGASIHEYDEASREFRMRATHNYDPELVESYRATPIRMGQGLTGRAAERREPMQVPDIAPAGAYQSHLRDLVLRMGFRALLSVPLVREDQVIGALVVNRRVPGEFAPEVVELLKTFATQSALAIQNARLFREIEEKGRQLEVASRHKSQFLANMSHELRTPLNAILGYTELIQDRIYGEVPPKIGEVMGRVDKSGRHLLGLINDVLDLSKIEAGQLALTLADYSMKEVVHTVVTAVESLAAEKRLALKAIVSPDLPRGRGDERRLTQVLLNLVGNALKFTEAGEVRIDARVGDGTFVVSVADTGPGIAPADQSRIFEEFQQADTTATRKKGGTGLGLSIARRIVELHGGRLGVDSAPGRGATFTLTVPVRVERQVGSA
jgi:GAF domain-containing protein/anti-sigma regulatory factor (Ser/Thr protein kinase)